MSPNRLLVALGVTALLSLPACSGKTPDDYADTEAFVAYAIPAVLGRRASSHQEVQALARLAESEGKGAVLAVLYEQPEFSDYWSTVFMDILKVDRADNRAPQEGCYDAPATASAFYPALAEHVATAPAKEPFCLSLSVVDAYSVELADVYGKSRVAAWTKELTGKEPAVDLSGSHLGAKQLELGTDNLEDAFDNFVAVQTSTSSKPTGKEAKIEGISGVAAWSESVEEEVEAGKAFSAGLESSPELVKGELCIPFNMVDLLRASIQEDRLDALYRGYLAPMSMALSQSEVDTTEQFFEVYLDRNPGCMECHDSNYSTTDPTPRNHNWDRFAPVPGVALELDAFSYEQQGVFVSRPLSAQTLTSNVQDFFSLENFIRKSDASGGDDYFIAFGMEKSCVTGTIKRRDEAAEENGMAGFAETQAAAFGFEPGDSAGVVMLIDRFAEGVAAMPHDSYSAAPTTTGGDSMAGAAVLQNCTGCHTEGSETAPADLIGHTADMTEERIFDIVHNGSPAGGMAGGYAGSEEAARDVAAYLASHSEHNTPLIYDTDGAALSQLVAQAVVTDVVEAVTGARLVLDHGFPRNEEAALTLGSLAYLFQDSGWSLKVLLHQILLSDYINRLAPADSTAVAYGLPQLANPYSMAPDGISGDSWNANGQGDLVHRWSADSLLRHLHIAMEWELDSSFSSSDHVLREDLGGYRTYESMPFRETFLDMMLVWEDTYGSCANPGTGDDFIDALTDRDSGLTIGEAMLAVKDRLVSNPTWDPALHAKGASEAELAASLTRLGSLSSPAYYDEPAIRDYCGALLRSPQFLFAGLPPWTDGTDPEPLEDLPCAEDALCSEDDYCQEYRETALDLGYDGFDCPSDE